MEKAKRCFVKVGLRGSQAGLQMAASGMRPLPDRPGLEGFSVTASGLDFGIFFFKLGAPWGSFPVGILAPIPVIKTMTENRPFNNNSLQRPNSRRQNDDRNRG